MLNPISSVGVYLSGTSFVFTSNGVPEVDGSAFFFKDLHGFTLVTEALLSDGTSLTRGPIQSARYVAVGGVGEPGGEFIYEGNYGSINPVPEVTSSFTLLALVSSGLLLRRRTMTMR